MRDEKRGAGHRHDHARRAPVAARDAHAHPRHRRRSPAAYARALPQLLSLECWGGATFDVAMRFLTEDPWERLAPIREARAEHPAADAAARRQRRRLHQLPRQCRAAIFVKQAADGGIDLFRVFDCLNWVENMRVGDGRGASRSGKLCEAAICYTGDILDPARAKYDLKYYVGARQGAGEGRRPHPRRSRTWPGLLKPAAARAGQGAARGDRPADPFPHARHLGHRRPRRCWRRSKPASTRSTRRWTRLSGTTSQPCLGSIVEALKGTERDPGLDRAGDPPHLVLLGGGAHPVCRLRERPEGGRPPRSICTRCRAGSSPTSRSRRARSGSETRWHEVAQAYRDVNRPVRRHRQGDAVLQGGRRHGADDGVAGPHRRRRASTRRRTSPSPSPVVEMLRGDLGQPPGGWPKALQKKVLKGAKPITVAAGLAAQAGGPRRRCASEAEEQARRAPSPRSEFASYLMYPKVFTDFAATARQIRAGLACCRRRCSSTALKPGDEITRRHRGRQDAGACAHRRLGDTDEDGQVDGVLRAQRPAARHHACRTAPPAPRQRQDAPQGGGGQRRACRRADAGRRCRRSACKAGQAVKAGDVLMTHRGDEDGDGPSRRARRHGGRACWYARRPDRLEGFAGGVGVGGRGLAKRRRLVVIQGREAEPGIEVARLKGQINQRGPSEIERRRTLDEDLRPPVPVRPRSE